MKKIVLLLTVFFLSMGAFAQESRMFVAPGRETFFAFPSEILGDKYTLTVFLPTEVAPISKHYPVIYFIGLDRSDREKFQQFAQKNNVFLAGLFIPEEELESVSDKLTDFIGTEWVPYMDTNYATEASPSSRILAIRGEVGVRGAVEAFKAGNFGALSLLNPGTDLPEFLLQPFQRVYVKGTQEELAAANGLLDEKATYGEQYALDYADYETGWLDGLNMKYLQARPQDLKVKKITMQLGSKALVATSGKSTSLQVYASLANGLKTVVIPQNVRTSPPFLDWQAPLGMLRVRDGAETGPITIKINVDAVESSAKIMLKKQ